MIIEHVFEVVGLKNTAFDFEVSLVTSRGMRYNGLTCTGVTEQLVNTLK